MKKLIILLIALSCSCAPKVYNARTTQKPSSSGAASNAKIQSKQNFYSVLKRTDPDRKLLWLFPYPDFLR